MCWKYEDFYSNCFDYLTFSFCEDKCLMDIIRDKLREDYGVDFVGDFNGCFFDMLSECHEKGIIKPIKEEKENED